MTASTTNKWTGSALATDWADPGYFARQSPLRNGLRILKQLISQPRGHRTMPTKAGIVLILLSLGIGTAAYNNSSNILFIILALLLSSLLLSGLLSWINFKGTRWRIESDPHLRVGVPARIRIIVENHKKYLPSYGFWFHLVAEKSEQRGRLPLEGCLFPGGSLALDWSFLPVKRGHESIGLSGLESQFPFGFLRKSIRDSLRYEIPVWPARIAYRFQPPGGRLAHDAGSVRQQRGAGGELVNLRPYRPGDPLRTVHWKATARQRKLVVQEFSEERAEAYLLAVESPRHLWTSGEQIETLCEFAATLAEDLFLQGRLWGTCVNGSRPRMVRRQADLHAFFNEMSVLQAVSTESQGAPLPIIKRVNFRPGNGKEVFAYVGGQLAGSA